MLTNAMFKKALLMLALVGAFQFGTAVNDANAWVVVRRVAPVRRVARAVLPPYPIARRVVAGPMYGPAYGPAYFGGYGYGPGVYVGF